MTDNEIVKALECCIKDDCINCPLDTNQKCLSIYHYALDLINSQKAEIERLKGINDNKTKELLRYNDSIEELHKKLETAKAETYKECVAKVRKLAVGMHPCSDEIRIFDSDLDNLAKEIIGE